MATVVEEMAVAFTTEGEADIEHVLHELTEAVEHLGEVLHHVKPPSDQATQELKKVVDETKKIGTETEKLGAVHKRHIQNVHEVTEVAAHGRHVVGEELEGMGVFTEQIAKRIEHVGVTMAFTFASMANGGEAGLARLLHAGASLAFMFGTIPGVVATVGLAIGEYLFHALNKSAEMAEKAKEKWEAYVNSLGEGKNLEAIEKGIKALETGNKFLTVDKKHPGATMYGALEELVKTKGGLEGLDKEIQAADKAIGELQAKDTDYTKRVEAAMKPRKGLMGARSMTGEDILPPDLREAARLEEGPEVRAERKKLDALKDLRKQFMEAIEELKKQEEPAIKREEGDAEFTRRMEVLKDRHTREALLHEQEVKEDTADYDALEKTKKKSDEEFAEKQLHAIDERRAEIRKRQHEDLGREDENASDIIALENQRNGVLLELERQRVQTRDQFATLRLQKIRREAKEESDILAAKHLAPAEVAPQQLEIDRRALERAKAVPDAQASAYEDMKVKVTADETALAQTQLATIQQVQKAETDALAAKRLPRAAAAKEQLRIDEEALARAKKVPNLQAEAYEGMVAKVTADATAVANVSYQDLIAIYDEHVRGIERAELNHTMMAAAGIEARHDLAVQAGIDLLKIANLTEEQIREGKKKFSEADIAEEKRKNAVQVQQAGQLTGLISHSMKSAFDAAFSGDVNPASAFGKALVAGLGDILSEQGSLYLKYGIIMSSLTPLLGDPFTAGPAGIAIGLALMALGSALKASASAHAAGGGAGGHGGATTNAVGGSYSSGLPQIGMINPVNPASRSVGNTGMLSSAQPITVNATIIGKDDPSAQRALLEMISRAQRRGTTSG